MTQQEIKLLVDTLHKVDSDMRNMLFQMIRLVQSKCEHPNQVNGGCLDCGYDIWRNEHK